MELTYLSNKVKLSSINGTSWVVTTNVRTYGGLNCRSRIYNFVPIFLWRLVALRFFGDATSLPWKSDPTLLCVSPAWSD